MNTPNDKVGVCCKDIDMARETILEALLTTGHDKVEGEAQGDEEALKKLLKDLNNGPSHAHVVKLEKSEIDVVEGENDFVVKREGVDELEETQ